MARRLRIEYPGAFYHVSSRGDRHEPIARDDHDRDLFLQTVGQACRKTGWRVHAVCLLPDHFHLLIETPQPNLAQGMQWLLGTYTQRFNRRHGISGHLFGGRYRSQLVDGRDAASLRTVSEFVHLHPARAGLIDSATPLRDYRWCSVRWLTDHDETVPDWFDAQRVYAVYGLDELPPEARGAAFERAIETQRRVDHSHTWLALRRAWAWGPSEFLDEVVSRLGQARLRMRSEAGGPPPELAERYARQIIAEELAARGWTAQDLAALPKTDPEKIRIAERLRRETTMSVRWIAAALSAGSPYTLRNALQYPWLRAGTDKPGNPWSTRRQSPRKGRVISQVSKGADRAENHALSQAAGTQGAAGLPDEEPTSTKSASTAYTPDDTPALLSDPFDVRWD